MPTTHSPGPWEIYHDEFYTPKYRSQVSTEPCEEGHRMKITVESLRHKADAALIAAAPELLDMLKLLHKNRKELPTEMQWQRASELIAKAEGGAA